MSEPRAPSYYSATINNESEYPQLTEEIRADVAIIGGGFTGVNTALELAARGLKVALLEANKIGWGATGRNGGQITGSLSGERTIRKQVRKTLGQDTEDFIWKLRWHGHDIIRRRVNQYAIQCDLTHGHLHVAYKPSDMKTLGNEFDELCRHGMGDEVTLLRRNEITDYLESDIYHGGIYNRNNMHVHPLNLCLGEAKAAADLGVHIFESTKVTHIAYGRTPVVYTEQGQVRADTVLLAGNAYHRLERKRLSGKIFQAAGGIVTTEPLSDEVARAINPKNLAVYDSRFVLDYHRLTADKRLLFGGGANYSGKESRNIEAELRPALERTFPRLKGINIDFQWSGMMGIVINRIPQLGKLSDNVFYAQGYSGHGISTSHTVAEIMANAITGHMTTFDVFAACKHIRIPVNEWFGNQFLSLGMWYYVLLEKLR